MNKRKTLRMTSILLALMMFFGMVSVLLVPAGVAGAADAVVEIDIDELTTDDTDNVVVTNSGTPLYTLRVSDILWANDSQTFDSVLMTLFDPSGAKVSDYTNVFMTGAGNGLYTTSFKASSSIYNQGNKNLGLYTMELVRYYGAGKVDLEPIEVAAFYLARTGSTNKVIIDQYPVASSIDDKKAYTARGGEVVIKKDVDANPPWNTASRPYDARIYSNSERIFTGTDTDFAVAKGTEITSFDIPANAAHQQKYVFNMLTVNESLGDCLWIPITQDPANAILKYASLTDKNAVYVDAQGPTIGDIVLAHNNLVGKLVTDNKLFQYKTRTNTSAASYSLEVNSVVDSEVAIGKETVAAYTAQPSIYYKFTNLYNNNIVYDMKNPASSTTPTAAFDETPAPVHYSSTTYPNVQSRGIGNSVLAALSDQQWKVEVVAIDALGNTTTKEYGRIVVYPYYDKIEDIRVEAENVLTMYKGQVLTKEEILNQNVKVKANTESLYGASFPDAWYFSVNASDSAYLDYDPEAGTITALQAGEARLTASPYDIWANENLRNNLTSSGTGQYIRVVITEAPEVTSLTLNNTTMTIDEGKTQKLTATVVPSAVAVTWESSDTSIATVASDGTVTGVKAGTAVIFAKAGHLTKSCVVTVKSTTIVDPDPPAEDLKGWVDENNNRYYYVDNQKVVGWRKIDGSWYFFDYTSAAMRANGWLKEGGKWYYLNSNGTMKSAEWFKDNNGKWYWLKANGAMAAGWEKINGTWYYFNASGAMQTGWVNVRGIWYYMKSSGAMAEGWLQDGGSWYYLTPGGGAMVTGRVTINGRASNFATSGRWLGYV